MEDIIDKLFVIGVSFVVLVVWMALCKPEWLGGEGDDE